MPAEDRRVSLAEKLVREFENLQRDRPYETYGAGVKRKANELLARSKRGQKVPGQNWNFQEFPPDALRVAMTNDTFAKDILRSFDPSFAKRSPQAADISNLRRAIDSSVGHQLFPQVQQGTPFSHFPRPNPQQLKQIRQGMKARLAENQNLTRQAETLLGQTNRLAPLSSLHTTAKQMIMRNNPSESLRLGRQEITAAGRTNIPREIDPYLKKASESPETFMGRYNNQYTGRVINNFRREAARDFLENDLPRINTQFASRGAFHSGARQAAIQKARAHKEQRIESEIARLLHTSHEEGMKHFHNQRGHHLRQAEVAGHAHQAQQDSHLRAAEHLRVNSNEEQRALLQQASALQQMGRAEQDQAQNELNVRQLEHREEMERPYAQQVQKASLAHGIPYPHSQLTPQTINPSPPNVYALGSGLMGQMAGMLGQQSVQMHAKGGHVRRGYAAGDSVARAASQLRDMAQHIQETPEEAEMRQSAQGFKNYRANPMADYLFAAGSHQLANLSRSPMETYGEGSQLGMNAYKNAQSANLSAQEKYNNLIGKINQSKMNQRDFLAKHHATMQQHEEMLRNHQAQENESRRGHDLTRDHHKAMQELALEKLRTDSGRPKLSASDKKLEADARKDLLRAVRMKKEVGHLGKLIEKTSSGPIIGGIKSVLPKTKVDNLIEGATNKLILDMHQGMKNIPRSEEFMKRIESTKPNRSNHLEANKQALSLMDQGADDVLENSITTLLSSGWTPEEIEKKFKVKVPPHLLDEREEVLPQEENESQQSSFPQEDQEDVPMIGPDGEEWMIPKEHVEAALQAGGQMAGGG